MAASLNSSLQALQDAVAYNATLVRFFASPFAYEVCSLGKLLNRLQGRVVAVDGNHDAHEGRISVTPPLAFIIAAPSAGGFSNTQCLAARCLLGAG